MNLKHLKNFRLCAYQLLGTGKDAVMDLMDAVLVTRSVDSFAELSLSPVFRRKGSSIYEAIEDCTPPRRGNHDNCTLMKSRKTNGSSWQETIQLIPDCMQKLFKTEPSFHGAKVISGKPITLGHGYSTIAWIRGKRGKLGVTRGVMKELQAMIVP